MQFMSELIKNKKIDEAHISPINFFHDTSAFYKGGQLIRLKKIFLKRDDLFLLLYVDDGTGFFSSLSDAITGSNIIFREMARLDLNMHIGRNNKPSKTEAVLFPSRKALNKWLLKYENMKISSTSEINIIVDVNGEEKKLYDEATEK